MYCSKCGEPLKLGEEVVRVTAGFVAREPGEGEYFFQTVESNDYYHRDCLLVVVRYSEIVDR